jgi:hypothetical protein
MRIADSIAGGMSPEEARRDALIRFGNRTVIREGMTAADAELAFDALWHEACYAARQLRRSLTFTTTAVITLILGIGANVVVFSVVNALVLRPLDVPQPTSLYNVVHQAQGYDNMSYPDYVDFQSKNATFSDMAVYRMATVGLSSGNVAYKCCTTKFQGIISTCWEYSQHMAGCFTQAMNTDRTPLPRSGLSESNRHLNLGKVRGVESNALERRHLADLKEPLIGK